MGSRTLLGVVGWLVAAAVAVAVGVTAVRVIGAGLTSPTGPTLPADEVAEALREPPGVAGPSGGTSATPRASPGTSASPPSLAVGTRTFRTRGGVVTARCADGRVHVPASAPAQGYAVHEVSDATVAAEVEFRADRTRVRLHLRCDHTGSPQLTTEVRDG